MKRIVYMFICLLAVVAVAQAQTDCEKMLEAAEGYYNKGDYDKAAKEYRLILESCPGGDYGGAATKLRKCNQLLKEDADFGKCNTIAACNDYLENYPNGRYVNRVQQIRTEIIKASVNAAEDDKAYQDCITKEDYSEYLRKHPYGRHVSQARAMVKQFEENEAYENCITEADCDAYLESFPDGMHYSEILAKKNVFEEERMRKEREAAKTAYMNIREVDFANTHSGGTVIDDYGAPLYISEIHYLTPRISYDALLDETRQIAIFYKIFKPDGTLMYKTESPFGYTFSHIFKVQPGSYNLYELPAWGSDSDGYYEAGIYRFELWFQGSRVYQTSFEIIDRENALSRGSWRTAIKKCCENVSYDFGNGSKYKGQYENRCRSGLGMYSWKDIDFYIGDWSSKGNGIGIRITPAGCLVLNCPDCEYYVGGFSSGEKSGTGSCYDKYGNLIYHGSFTNDRPTQTYPSTGYDNCKFECIEYYSGDYYVGETYGGKPHGKGVYIWSNGDMWYGEWKYGNRDGNGINMLYQGSVSAGM